MATAAEWSALAWGDPLDFSNAEDVRLLGDRSANLGPVEIADGRLAFETTGIALVTFVFPGFGGALPLGRDGAATPIDADRFTHVTLRINVPQPMPVAWLWDTCAPVEGQTGEQCRGHHQIILQPGWQTVVTPLGALTAGQSFAWAGDVTALRLSLGTGPGSRVEIDEVRIHEAPATVPVQWDTLAGPALAVDSDALPAPEIIATGGAFSWPAGAYPPGTYRFFATGGAADGAASDPVVVDAAPAPVVLDPDLAGGEDYATALTGNPWDFSAPDDVLTLRNAADASYAGGVLSATNAGADPGDPNFFLRTGPPIDASRYHRLTVRTRYEGPFGLAEAPGGGAHGRLMWTRADMDQDRVLEGNKVIESKELVHYPDENGFTVDLRTDPAAALMEDDSPSRAGWTGSPVTHVRYDPNEDPGSRRWTIDEISLRADDEARGAFDVRWRDVAGGDATVSLYLDSDRSGSDGQLVASGIEQRAGDNVYRLDTTGVSPGTYWLELAADDGLATTRAYATGPLVILGGAAAEPVEEPVARPGTPSTSGPQRSPWWVAPTRWPAR